MRYIVFLIVIFVTPLAAMAQSSGGSGLPAGDVGPIRSSAAYAEVLLRKTELQAELEAVLPDYTEENPKVIDARFEIGILTRDIDRIYAVRPTEVGKLTLALGKLLVKRAALETELQRLQRSYNKDHPEVKRAKRRIEIFESSIKQILG
ncbi:MAG: hypothetical protein IPG67_08110 [Acidobacteria bacterium]|nr:hypothetical protein [Acidobacteriota bacterium]